jgi:hypothetical protein
MNRELTARPEPVRGQGGYRLALRSREFGRVHYVGQMLVTRAELVKLVGALQGICDG